MIIIGEKINGSIPIVAEAIAKRDSEFIKARAKLQAESGATYIDCCASVPEAEEVETLKWMIDCIQEVTDLPISIDSPSPDVLAQAYNGTQNAIQNTTQSYSLQMDADMTKAISRYKQSQTVTSVQEALRKKKMEEGSFISMMV